MPIIKIVRNRRKRWLPLKGQLRLNPKDLDTLQVWTGFRWKNGKRLSKQEEPINFFNNEVNYREQRD